MSNWQKQFISVFKSKTISVLGYTVVVYTVCAANMAAKHMMEQL